MTVDQQALDELRGKIIGCAMAVHRALGPGLLESIYRDCLVIELRAEGCQVEQERSVSLRYRRELIPTALRMDLIVNGQLVVEIKSVERLHPIHSAQVITYLKLSGFPEALLLNFNTTALRSGLKKLVHPELYSPRFDESASRPPELS
jgi:GxxExxY protein